jgi:4-hydroxy-tetrahydrodipicolinate synthase
VARWNARFQPLFQPLCALFRELSGLRVIYAAADALDICRMEPPRPILPLSPAIHQRVAAALAKLDPDDR